VTELVPRGRHLERALAMAAGIAAYPQDALLADRRALLDGQGRPLAEGLEIERRLGRETLPAALRGAERFRAGEGRGGAGAGV
jgi:enoyl-CoA hydratase